MRRVIVGMSGGVDSSVAALLLQRQGYAVEGLFMFNWDEDEEGYCTAAQDFQDARQVCDELGITLHRADFSRDYREQVFQYLLDEYASGRTPNPDVLCNREIKFKSFLKYARRLGADKIATGHYARLERNQGLTRLLKGVDNNKDQSYFLAAVPAEAFAHALFPLGGLHKREVRELAQQAGFANYDKKDSTGICFIGERRLESFLSNYLPAQPGPIQALDGPLAGQRIGEHSGLMYYTLGQRKGLGIGGRQAAGEAPWYVIRKDLDSNTLLVSQDPQHSALLSQALECADFHWVNSPPRLPLRCAAKIRYRQADQTCEVLTAKGGGLRVRFAKPQKAAAPGQYLVLYDGQRCLGAGAIEATQSLAADDGSRAA